MKKIVNLSLILLFCLSKVTPQSTQLKRWYVGGNDINMASPSLTSSTLPITNPSVNLNGAANGIYDVNGNIQFYITAGQVFNKFGTSVGQLKVNNLNLFTTVSVVPFSDNDNCKNKYYIFYVSSFNGLSTTRSLFCDIVDVDIITGNINFSNYTPTANSFELLTIGGSFSSAIAVSNLVNNRRFLYVVNGTGSYSLVHKLTISSPTQPNFGISTPELIYQSSVNTAACGEAELSVDGTKLCFYNGNTTFSNSLQFTIIGLSTSTGNFNSHVQSFSVPSNTNPYTPGIEFNQSGSKLFFSTGGNSSGAGIYVRDLTSNTNTLIPGTADYANSQLEMANNGIIYAAKQGMIQGIDPNTNSLSSSFINVNTQSTSGGYLLPNQIDGCNYDAFLFNATVYNQNTFNAFGNQTWTPTNNPINNSGQAIRIKDELNFTTSNNAPTNIVLENMVFEFGPNAIVNIQPNVTVTLRNTTFKGVECGIMWQGVRINGNGAQMATLNLQKNGSLNGVSKIRDAIIGTVAKGLRAKLNMVDNTIFEANEMDVNVINCLTTNINIVGCYLIGNKILKDQTKGSANGYSDGLKRTNISIRVENCSQPINIGSSTGVSNTIVGSQFGIQSINSSLNIVKNYITQIYNTAIYTDGALRRRNVFFISENKITNLVQGIRLDRIIAGATITKNTFSYTSQYAIHYTYNPNSVLVIGGTTNQDKNTFNNCNWAAIHLYNNQGFNTEITIRENEIKDIGYAYGIVIGEPAAGTNASYKKLQVQGNTLNNIPTGILLTNIRGGNSKEPTISNFNTFSTFELTSNTINFTTTNSSPSQSGILASNSGYLNILNNSTTSNVSSNWRNSGIQFTDGPHTLIYGNNIIAGKGLLVRANMLNSNYYCNTFTRCVNGIQLNWEYLRANLGTTHGIRTTEARENTFINRWAWGDDINVHTNRGDLNQWIFKANTALPKISYPFGGLSIRNGTSSIGCSEAFSPTPTDLPSDLPSFANSDLINNWKTENYKQTLYARGVGNTPTNNQEVIAVLHVEDLIHDGLYTQAQAALEAFDAQSAIAIDYKTVYTILINSFSINEDGYDNRPLSAEEIATLTTIATKNALTQSPAAYNARAILWNENQTIYEDTIDEFKPSIDGYVGVGCGFASIEEITVNLMSEGSSEPILTTTTNAEGLFSFAGHELANLNAEASYYLTTTLPNGELKTSETNNIETLAYSSYHNLGCGMLGKKGMPVASTTNQTTNQAVHIYPNPGNDYFYVSGMDAGEVLIYDLLGKQVAKAPFTAKQPIAVGHLQKGIYFIKLLDVNNQLLKTVHVQVN